MVTSLMVISLVGPLFLGAPAVGAQQVFPSAVSVDGSAPPAPASGRPPQVGDLDGDGFEDLLWWDGGRDLTIWYGREDRGHSAVTTTVGTATRAVVGDFNGDNVSDVFWAPTQPGRRAETWFGTQGRRWRVETVTAPPTGGDAAVADIDGNGTDDLIWVDPDGPDDLLMGLRSGGFSGRPLSVLGRLLPTVGDLDGDGAEDVVWYDAESGDGVMWWGGATISAAPFPIGTGFRVVAADLGGDGRDDLLISGPDGRADAIFFTRPGRLFEPYPIAVEDDAIAVPGDLDGDGADDVLWYRPGPGADAVWFSRPGRIDAVDVTSDGMGSPVTLDADGDGATDVALAERGEGRLTWWFGRPGSRPRIVANDAAPGGLIVHIPAVAPGSRAEPPLALVTDVCGRSWAVHRALASQAQDLLGAATAAGVGLCVNSAFRSYAEQVAIRAARCASVGLAGEHACVYEWTAGTWPFVGGGQVARPGFSRHQSGVALDLGDREGYVTDVVVAWLSANAHRFGFYNLGDTDRTGPAFPWGWGGEPWHVSIDGR